MLGKLKEKKAEYEKAILAEEERINNEIALSNARIEAKRGKMALIDEIIKEEESREPVSVAEPAQPTKESNTVVIRY